jgi:hypothetical protein
MSHAPEVAERIVKYAKGTSPEEPPVVAVVGLTMVGTVTSADGIPELSRLYHQVRPTNLWESQVVAQHVRNLGVRDVTVYYEEGDLYSKNLAEDIETQLGDSVRLVDPQRSNPTDSVKCEPDSMVFFSGRADQFGKYLTTVQDKCVEPEKRPRRIAGDDTTNFLLDRQLPPGVQLDYIDFTGLRVQEGTDGLVGRGLLAFDAVDLVRQAVRKVTDGQVEVDTTPLNGQAAWYGIARLGENPGDIRANSGPIDFGAPVGQVPVRKAISVMRVAEAGPVGAPQGNYRKPVRVMHCGNTPRQTAPCPP